MLNRYGITRAAHQALSADTYDLQSIPPNVRSITTITDDVKKKILEKRHLEEAKRKIDCQNDTWMVLGSAAHYLMEQALAGDSSFMTEERWIMDTETWDLWWITDSPIPIEVNKWYRGDRQYLTGKLDCYDRNDHVIEDYKTAKTNKLAFPLPDSYVWQINAHKLALDIAGLPVKKGVITYIFRNWEKYDITKNRFPTPPIKSCGVALYDNDTIKKFIRDRIRLFVEMEQREDDDIPECENRYHKNGRCLSNEPALWCYCRLWCHYYRGLIEQ